MGQSSSSNAPGEQPVGGQGAKYQGLFMEAELEEITQTFESICGLGKETTEGVSGFSLLQLQKFIGGKLSASIVKNLHRQLQAKNEDPQSSLISKFAFVSTMESLLKGTAEEQGTLIFSLVSDDEDAQAMSIGQMSKVIDTILTSYEEALKTCNKMNNWEISSTPEANQLFINLVLQSFGSDGNPPASEVKVSRDEFVRWLQQTPLVQQVFADVFHLCFSAPSKSPSAASSAETDTSVLHELPSLPKCLDINWRKTKSQLDVSTLLILNHHVPHHLQDQWRFLYSSNLHGASFATLLSHIAKKGPTVLLVRDTEGHLFGGFASDSWEIGPSFVGSSRCFLFSLAPKVGIYESSGQNDHYMYLNIDQQTLPNGLGMGGQFDYFGLWIDQEFGKGHSKARPKCTTYSSPQLSAKEEFTIDFMEAWAVGPPPKKPEEEDEDAKKSILDKDPEAQALLELVGKGRKSEGLREDDPMADIPEVHEMPTK